MEVLSVMPQSVEEIGDANLQYSKLQERKPEVRSQSQVCNLILLFWRCLNSVMLCDHLEVS